MFDSEQRDLTESEKECLKILADEIILKLLYFNQEEAESVSKLKNKFQKVLDVATDLVYELEWESGNLAWGDELTDILGYPNEERFVDYDWWLDKIHPDDLERVLHDVSMTVEGENRKV
ncbi:MAG: PAS domain-containing protein [Gracilimonas sp.]|nr:PAS domain-containing protein [Gracilimonas sp.]